MINKIVNLMGVKGALILVFLEYLCFPIPSEVVLPIMGYFANYQGNFVWMIFLSIIASLMASLLLYLVGYYGGSKLLNTIYNKFSWSNKSIDFSQRLIEKHSKIALCLSRVIPLSRTYISLVAGMFKCELATYIFYSSLGITIWNTILISLGYIMFDNLNVLEVIYGKYKMLILIAFSVSIIVIFMRKLLLKKR